MHFFLNSYGRIIYFWSVNYLYTYNKTTVLLLQNKETLTSKLNCEIITATESQNMATFYVRFRSCFLLYILVCFFIVFSLFLIYFYCFFNDFDLFPHRFLDIYFKKSSKFEDVSKKVERPNQTKPTHNGG